MKKFTKNIFTALFCTLALISCKKEDSEDSFATLIIKPKVLGCSNDGVRVRLFESEDNYNQNQNYIEEKYSEGDNPVIFEKLEEKVYYFQCFKVCGGSMTANNFCDPSIETYATNGSLSADHLQEIEVQLCY